MDKSWQPCQDQGIVFLPLAVESLGAWNKSAICEVKKLGSLARHTGEEESVTIMIFVSVLGGKSMFPMYFNGAIRKN